MAQEKTSPHRQTFSITAPTAMSVQLVGAFTHWQENPVALSQGRDGMSKVTVAVPSGTHHYCFLVDGQWRDDPESTLRVPDPFGGDEAVRQVG